MKIEHDKMENGQEVFVAWVYVDSAGTRVDARVDAAVTENASAGLIRLEGGSYRQVYSWDTMFSTAAEAHTHVAKCLEDIASRVSAMAQEHRSKAAGLAAKAQVVYV